MGKFLVFFAVGVAAGITVDFLWGKNSGFMMMGNPGRLGQLPGQPIHPGFIPLETPRSTLANPSATSVAEARVRYLSQANRGGMGQIDYFLM